MSDRNVPHSRQHNQVRRDVQPVYVEKTVVRAAFKDKEGFSLSGTDIHIKVPRDTEIIRILKSLRAKWNPTKKHWVLPVGLFEQLRPHIDTIATIASHAWHESVNASLREHFRDFKIDVLKDDLSFYVVGSPAHHKGKDYMVSYVGRVRELENGSQVAGVYLSHIDSPFVSHEPDLHDDEPPSDEHDMRQYDQPIDARADERF